MKQPSRSHLLLIPTYNTGPLVVTVVKDALKAWRPVWVVVDGSDDGSAEALEVLAKKEDHLSILRYPVNRGKGGAVYAGIQAAAKQGFTHVLTMDADGQHPVSEIMPFLQYSIDHPGEMILGVPVFDESAPSLRVNGRKISNFWANLETLWSGVNDSLFGFRVYPIVPLLKVMESTRFARRFDFDPEAAVRMIWSGVPVVNRPVPVRYLSAEEGGVSQFKYLRDNLLLTWMHVRLMGGFLARLPILFWRRVRGI